jgi:hypothetical protein
MYVCGGGVERERGRGGGVSEREGEADGEEYSPFSWLVCALMLLMDLQIPVILILSTDWPMGRPTCPRPRSQSVAHTQASKHIQMDR